MSVQIRAQRLEVTDRYPMLAFSLQSSEGPRLAEVVLLTDLALIANPGARNPANFYSSREHGVLTIADRGSLYTIPPQVLARFIGGQRLYFGLATASAPAGQDWRVDVLPGDSSPYVSLRSLSDRALRRVRMYPAQTRTRGGPTPAVLAWTGDRPTSAQTAPGSAGGQPASSTGDEPGTPSALVPYNDGFGPLPPLQPAAAAPATAAQGLGNEDEQGIDGPVIDELVPAVAASLAIDSPLTSPDYPGARLMPSPAFSSRGGTAIDRIVIHITSSGQSPYLGSHFTRPDANSSSHYMIDQNGAIIQFVREQDKAWHARRANARSIGIEHVAVERGGARYGSHTLPYTPPTQIELQTSAQLVAHLCRKYGLAPDRTTIVGHNEIDAGTSHSLCPTGAWDWDGYMQLVAAAYATLPAIATTPAASGQSAAMEIDSAQIRVTGERQALSMPQASVSTGLTAQAIETALSTISPAIAALRALVERAGVTIGIGPAVSAGVFVGGSWGAGIILAPGHVVGIYGTSEFDAGLIGSIGTQIQLTIVSGGIAAFTGVGSCVGVSVGEAPAVGASVLFDASGNFAGITMSVGVSEGPSVFEIFAGVQKSYARSLSMAMAGGGDTVEIKYRAFIPSPALKGPFFDNYHGDGRGFSYSSGSSRGEVTFTVDVSPGGGLSNLTYTSRDWSPSHSYSSSDTSAVAGKPDWWLNLNAGAVPTGTASCPTNDDTLRAFIGSDSTTTNVLAVAENASLVTIAMAGNNPLVLGSPAIDATVAVLIRRNASGGIEAKVFGSHDGFPAHELYVNRQRLYAYDPVAAGNSPENLFPPEDITADTGWTTVSGGASASGQALAMALAAGEGNVGPQQALSLPTAEPASNLRSIAIQAALALANPMLAPSLIALRAAVELSGLTVGIGPSVSAGLLAGGSLGVGLIFAPHNVIGVYGSGEIDAGWIASIGAQMQLTVVRGGIDAFNGVGYAAGVSAGEGIGGGAAALFDANRNFCGVTLSVGVSADLSPVQIYTGVQHSVATQLGLAQGLAGGSDPEDGEIAGPVVDLGPQTEVATASAMALADAEYPDAVVMPSPAFTRGRAGKAIDRIVVHITSSGQSPYLGSWFTRENANSSAHYMVDQLGTVRQFVSEADTAWHAGNRDFNRRSIGIEHVAVERGGATYGRTHLPYTPPSDIEYRTSAGLVAHLCRKYNLTPDRTTIVGHNEANPQTTHSSCPTGAWDWDLYMGLVAAAYALQAGASAVGSVVNAVRGAVGLGTDDWSINWDEVDQVAQPTNMGCWATTAAMITGWRDRVCIDPNEIARMTGLEPQMASGLSADQVKGFFRAVGLRPAPAACFSADGFRDLLERNGPAFVIARVPGLHAIVVTGMYRRDGQDYVRITDPWDRVVGDPGAPGAYARTHSTGSRYIMSYPAFAAEYEATAGWGEHQLAFGGVPAGRQPNRGSDAPAGYAQSLGDRSDPTCLAATPSRRSFNEDGRSYDLAQLAGMVRPPNALASGAGMQAIAGERVVLNDWPYIDDAGARTQADVAIDWKFDGAAVGDIVVAPAGGSVSNGRSVAVRADIEPAKGPENQAVMLVRVTTTFSKPGEPDQVAVNEVTLSGSGRSNRTHMTGQDPQQPTALSPQASQAAPAQPVMA